MCEGEQQGQNRKERGGKGRRRGVILSETSRVSMKEIGGRKTSKSKRCWKSRALVQKGSSMALGRGRTASAMVRLDQKDWGGWCSSRHSQGKNIRRGEGEKEEDKRERCYSLNGEGVGGHSVHGGAILKRSEKKGTRSQLGQTGTAGRSGWQGSTKKGYNVFLLRWERGRAPERVTKPCIQRSKTRSLSNNEVKEGGGGVLSVLC